MATFVKIEDACHALLDFINSEDIDKYAAKEDQKAFMSGLWMAGTIISARCDKYMIDLSQFDIHTDFSDFKAEEGRKTNDGRRDPAAGA